MKCVKSIFCTAIVMMAAEMFAAPYVTNVVAKQRHPWNGLVDVKYEIVGSTNEISGYVYGSLKAEDRGTGKVYPASTFVKPLDLSEGKHHAIWDMSADAEVVATNVVFSVSIVSIEKPTWHMVVNLSGGPNATSYPVSYLPAAPEGGWTDEYKTTKLVLRLIEPGSLSMNGSYDVTLTEAYYCGIFEITQKQYELVTGSKPSWFKGDMLPVEKVSWDLIRGVSSTHNWPKIKTVDSNSFVGRMRARTKIKFDLPTEAQWEYACRAGTITQYSFGDNADGDYMWFKDNSSNETKEVGTRLSNAWGLYDMHGNVMEWCLDWYGSLVGGINPEGPLAGNYRVSRGGAFGISAGECTSSWRHRHFTNNAGSNDYGFRIISFVR